jgi:hypothetical protein
MMVMVMLSICDDNDDDNGHSMTVIHGHIYKRPAYIIYHSYDHSTRSIDYCSVIF